jgi:hypothetical protein
MRTDSDRQKPRSQSGWDDPNNTLANEHGVRVHPSVNKTNG